MLEPILGLNEVQLFAHGLDHAEGICRAPDGYLYVGGEAGQVYRIETNGSPTELARSGGFALGLASDARSQIYMCDQVHHCVWRMDPVARTFDLFTAGTAETPMRVPNWGCFDSAGNYYVSDSGSWEASDGLIWRVDPSGRTEPWTRAVSNFPNGMAISADDSTLYILESVPPALVAVPINKDGTAGERRVIAEIPDTVPDGVALTDDGRFVVACYRPDSIYLVTDGGEYRLIATDPRGTALSAPTNVVFVGDELDEMVVPNLGRWHLSRFRVSGVRGVPLKYPRL